jgi:hypothetical protein
MNTPESHKVYSVRELLSFEQVAIPNYQRPYKWTAKNVAHLFQDLQTHSGKSAYRLGTVVFHSHCENGTDVHDIVDGQQRTLTLVLAVWALIESRLLHLERGDLKATLNQLKPVLSSFMAGQHFKSNISQENLHKNYLEIRRLVGRPSFTERHIEFLLEKCEVVVFVLKDVSEAFQFFDSQNARGRDLEPHDLLKAYHLREFSEHESDLKAATVADWEALESKDLTKLFAEYLFRIRRWALGHSARYFGKNEVSIFKGLNIDSIAHFPYVESLRISHHYVDDYNGQYQRKIDGGRKAFPFHLDQMIINGRRFFEMAAHYQHQVEVVVSAENTTGNQFLGAELSPHAEGVFKTLSEYPARHRTGDKYVRTMFDCALIFYIDKFGTSGISHAIEKLFVWAYTVRIKQQVVQLATMDNYVLTHNLFREIKDATTPSDILNYSLDTIASRDNKNNAYKKDANNDPLVRLFIEMNYYE